ncbi:MAG: methyltransferase domain-containing protein [Nitriliruptorales bacterium]|nr:methyltransferase domain-containing protein [Nitriliruptorales bacterium]
MTTQAPTPSQVRDAWDAIADGFDRYATPQTMAFGEQVLSRLELGPGVRVLDVAAGTGGLSIPAARTGADVVAVDISPAMIEHLAARGRTEGLTGLEARVGDGEALDFDDATFDVAVSMNGVSLFPDIPGGLRELVRVTRPGGQVLVVTFGPMHKAEFIAFFLGAMQATVPGSVPPPTGPPMPPFRLADPTTLRRTLQEASLRDVRVETTTWETGFDSVDHLLDTVLTSNPIAGQLTAGLTHEQFGQVRQVLDGMLRERSGGDPGAVLSCEMRIGQGTV